MGLSVNKPKNSQSEGWGLGLFLVFFPEDGDKYIDNKKMLSPSSSFRSTPCSVKSKAQSTISICAILVFITLLLFTLSNFDHTINPSTPRMSPRRWLSEKNLDLKFKHRIVTSVNSAAALQGMGTLFCRGTRAMSDLVVAHLTEELKKEDFRVFLRALHLSGVTARADVVMISSSFYHLSGVILQEHESFLKLVSHGTAQLSGLRFDLTQFTKERQAGAETLWGRKIRSNFSNSEEGFMHNTTEFSYGSVVGFEVAELDPADSLSGFFDNVPIRLRRWACYQMLLGRVRRNFKHIMFVDPKEVILLGDPLARVRHKGAESVHLWKNSDKTRSHSVTADAVTGGMRGVRWLSNAMVNEIVRAATSKKGKNSVSDSAILSQLVNNESLLRSSNMVTSTESPIPSASALVSTVNSSAASLSSLMMVHRGTNRNLDVNYILNKELCLSVLDSFVYRNCNGKNIL